MTSTEAPAPAQPSGRELTRARARKILAERFGFDDFQYRQFEPIQSVLRKRDALVVMPTGSGKSLVYQLPALMLPGLTVVVSPLIALMKDQQDKLVAQGVDALAMHSHLSARRDARDGATGDQRGRAARSSTSRPSASRTATSSTMLLHAHGEPVRRRRGALREPVGPRLPARLPHAGLRRQRGSGGRRCSRSRRRRRRRCATTSCGSSACATRT